MVYVERDETANIIAVYDNPQAGATEKLSVNSDELVAYLTQTENKAESQYETNAVT